jgi:predicted negative regulator of RcsB-dependent stress response
MKAGEASEALSEFARALEYPENLATGKLENSSQADIFYLQGNALAALGRSQEAVAAWKRASAEPESKNESKEQARKKAGEAVEKARKQ